MIKKILVFCFVSVFWFGNSEAQEPGVCPEKSDTLKGAKNIISAFIILLRQIQIISRSKRFWIPDKNEKILNDFFIFSGMTCGRIPYFKTGNHTGFFTNRLLPSFRLKLKNGYFSILNRNPEI